MTWSLNANGHLQNAEAEQELVKDLRKVLSKFGAQASVFGGTFAGRVEGLHIKDKDRDDAEDEGTEETGTRSRSRSRAQAKDDDGPGDGVHDEKPKALGVTRPGAPDTK